MNLAVLGTLDTLGRELAHALSYVRSHDWNAGFCAGLEIGARCAWQTVERGERAAYLAALQHRPELCAFLATLA